MNFITNYLSYLRANIKCLGKTNMHNPSKSIVITPDEGRQIKQLFLAIIQYGPEYRQLFDYLKPELKLMIQTIDVFLHINGMQYFAPKYYEYTTKHGAPTEQAFEQLMIYLNKKPELFGPALKIMRKDSTDKVQNQQVNTQGMIEIHFQQETNEDSEESTTHFEDSAKNIISSMLAAARRDPNKRDLGVISLLLQHPYDLQTKNIWEKIIEPHVNVDSTHLQRVAQIFALAFTRKPNHIDKKDIHDALQLAEQDEIDHHSRQKKS